MLITEKIEQIFWCLKKYGKFNLTLVPSGHISAIFALIYADFSPPTPLRLSKSFILTFFSSSVLIVYCFIV